MGAVSFYLPPATRSRLQACALLRKTSMSRIVSDALSEFVERHGLLRAGEWRIRPDASHAWCRSTAEQAEQARALGWEVDLADGP